MHQHQGEDEQSHPPPPPGNHRYKFPVPELESNNGVSETTMCSEILSRLGITYSEIGEMSLPESDSELDSTTVEDSDTETVVDINIDELGNSRVEKVQELLPVVLDESPKADITPGLDKLSPNGPSPLPEPFLMLPEVSSILPAKVSMPSMKSLVKEEFQRDLGLPRSERRCAVRTKSAPYRRPRSPEAAKQVWNIREAIDSELELVANLKFGDKVKVHLLNLARWRDMCLQTLDYRISDYSQKYPYTILEEGMRAFYKKSEYRDEYKVTLAEIKAKKLDFAVAETTDGKYMRVRIIHLEENEEWEYISDSDDDDSEGTEGAGVDGDDVIQSGSSSSSSLPSVKHVCIDSNFRVLNTDDNEVIDHHSLTFFYLHQQFCRIPYRTREFGLTDSEIFLHLLEFFDVGYEVLTTEQRVFRCTVDYINEAGIPFVTLRSSKDGMTLNERIYLKIISQALPAPDLAPVGQGYDDATISHQLPDGHIYIQFKQSELHQLFEVIASELQRNKYAEIEAKGPYTLDECTNGAVCLAPYDNWYYRCTVLKPEDGNFTPSSPEKVFVSFIDYGNEEEVDIASLVPCRQVDRLLAAFPNMAVKGRLRNVTNVNWDCVFTRLKGNIEHVAETLNGPTTTSVPTIELLSPLGGEVKLFSRSLLQTKMAEPRANVPWISPPTTFPSIIQQSTVQPSRVESSQMNWSADDGKLILAEPGAILEVILTRKGNSFDIIPVAAKGRVAKLRMALSLSDAWKYLKILTSEEYRLHRHFSVQPGCIVLYISCSEDDILKKTEDTMFSRVRVVMFKPQEDLFIVRNIDTGNVFNSHLSNLHPLPSEFTTLPAQAAQFKIKGGERDDWRGIPELALKEKRYLIRVEEVSVEDSQGTYGCCVIQGHLYERTLLKKKTGEYVSPTSQCLSFTAKEAQDYVLECPLTSSSFPRLGSFGLADAEG